MFDPESAIASAAAEADEEEGGGVIKAIRRRSSLMLEKVSAYIGSPKQSNAKKRRESETLDWEEQMFRKNISSMKKENDIAPEIMIIGPGRKSICRRVDEDDVSSSEEDSGDDEEKLSSSTEKNGDSDSITSSSDEEDKIVALGDSKPEKKGRRLATVLYLIFLLVVIAVVLTIALLVHKKYENDDVSSIEVIVTPSPTTSLTNEIDVANPTAAPTSSTTTEDTCEDAPRYDDGNNSMKPFDQSSFFEWERSDCSWYEEADDTNPINRCLEFGDEFLLKYEMTALEACCVCGGGSSGFDVGEAYENEVDYYDEEEEEEEEEEEQVTTTEEPIVSQQDEAVIVSPQQDETKKSLSTRTNDLTGTSPPELNQLSSFSIKCEDRPLIEWQYASFSSSAMPRDCAWYEEEELLETIGGFVSENRCDVYGNMHLAAYNMIANEACCACGGGIDVFVNN